MSQSALERAWYRPGSWAKALLPVSWLFNSLAAHRKRKLLALPKQPIDVPVVIVGNISVGGTGKTPLLLSIIDYFIEQGFQPGVVSRGYGGECDHYPCAVDTQSNSGEVGDEPLLYASKCPVVVDPNRDRAVRYLLDNNSCDVIFSDDGLQHYKLQRDVEIAVVDGQRGFGNGYCLPAGPLREPPQRLQSVDYVVINSGSFELGFSHPNVVAMSVEPLQFRNPVREQVVAAHEWQRDKRVHAVAGIGNPERFVCSLEQLGFEVELTAYPDHHVFTGDEFLFGDQQPVIITAKDAVKCTALLNENVWILDIAAVVSSDLLQQLAEQVAAVQKDKLIQNQSLGG